MFKKMSETVSVNCRWYHIASQIMEGHTIIWEDSNADYQGTVSILGVKNNKFKWLEYSYGSCNYCDSYEDLSEGDVLKAFETLAMNFSSVNTFLKWLKTLQKTKDSKFESINNEINLTMSTDDWTKSPQDLLTKVNMYAIFGA